jgi:hypothetical protein
MENRLGTCQPQTCPPTLKRLVFLPKKWIFGGTNTFLEHFLLTCIIPTLDLAQNWSFDHINEPPLNSVWSEGGRGTGTANQVPMA